MKKLAIALVALLILLVAGGWVAVRVLLAPERVRATVEARASAALGEQVRIGSAVARLFPRVGLELRDITIANTPTRLESVSVETGLRPLFSRRVENALVTISNGRIEIPWFIALLSSLSRVPASPAEPAGLTIVSVRAIELRDVVLTAGRHEVRVAADGLFQQDRLEISRLEAQGEGTSLTATGALTSLTQVRGVLAIDADTLNLDGLLALASAATPVGQRSTAVATTSVGETSGFSIEASVKARTGRVASILFSDLSAQMYLAPGGVRLQPAALRAFDGRFSGRVDVKTAAEVPETSVVGDLAGIDVAALSAFAGSPGAMSGRLAGHATVVCACLDLAGRAPASGGTAAWRSPTARFPDCRWCVPSCSHSAAPPARRRPAPASDFPGSRRASQSAAVRSPHPTSPSPRGISTCAPRGRCLR